jgi:hypothetical protein
MGWIFAIVALGLVMTALTLAEVRQPVRAMTVGERIIVAFVVGTCIAIVSGLILLAADTLP